MNTIQSIFAAPISWLYGAAVWVRNTLYGERLVHSHGVTVPTICVGNLAVGGTGKTPMVEYLVSMLSPKYRVAVLSRGYRRHTRGFVLADASSTALTIGDEPMQIHLHFPDVPVAVCKDRVHGIKHLQRLFPDLQCVILDDAFQYRRLHAGFNILLTAADCLYVDDHYLPWGRLRDNVSQSLRANVVVVTKCPPTLTPIQKRILDSKLNLPTYQHLYFSSVCYPPITEKGNPLVLTGIARPEYLQDYIRSLYPNATFLTYPDHHRWSDDELQHLEQDATYYSFVLTTDKDMARLRDMNISDSLRAKLIPVSVTMDISEPDLFRRQITTYVSENNRKH
ncbi:MAG: tetraacyldisaccharide 4'-kinase [Paludibacteraceae bacterium]|nr:tetraacyldisaccharide 4'-kinase [Paludibacteraceae bacterium]